MGYVSFSLKYRPQRFEDVVGQDHVSRTLMNAVRTNRVAHAYLFAGPRGTGKTSSARVLAKALNCVHGPTPEPCGKCEFCLAVQDGRALDVIEIDAASNRGIDEIRDLREKVKYSPAQARYKVYILDEVHMLTTEAFNALLKTLEEPPAHSFFVLATTEPHKVPATIVSRCQRFDFRPIPVTKIVQALTQIVQNEGIQAEPEALEAVARAADGAMRDAESILDQVVAYTDGVVTADVVKAMLGVTEAETLAEIADLVADADVAGCFALVDRVMSAGKDVSQLLADLTAYMRDLLRLSLGTEPASWQLPGDEGRARLIQQAQALGSERIMECLRALAQAQQELRSSSQHAILLELTLAKLCQPAPSPAPSGARPPQSLQGEKRAPTPARDTEAPPRPPQEDLNLEAILSRWGALPQELRRMGRAPLGAFIPVAQPVDFSGGVLTVAFDKEYTFHYTQMSGQYRQVVEEALARLLGQKVSLRCVLTEASTPTLEAQDCVTDAGAGQPAELAVEAAPTAENTPPESPAPPTMQPACESSKEAETEKTRSAVDKVVQWALELYEGSRELREDE